MKKQYPSWSPLTATGTTIAPLIDHTLLKADTRHSQVLQLCSEARHYGFAAVCVLPIHLTLAVRSLADSPVKAATVIGFPLGAMTSKSKAFEAAEAVNAEVVGLLSPFREWVRTITYDNGREFCGHGGINEALGCQSYFAAPYHSWERGLNENTNGLIRQYFPKGSDLRRVAPDDIDFVQNRLNSRPRKTLDYRTPQEVFL